MAIAAPEKLPDIDVGPSYVRDCNKHFAVHTVELDSMAGFDLAGALETAAVVRRMRRLHRPPQVLSLPPFPRLGNAVLGREAAGRAEAAIDAVAPVRSRP